MIGATNSDAISIFSAGRSQSTNTGAASQAFAQQLTSSIEKSALQNSHTTSAAQTGGNAAFQAALLQGKDNLGDDVIGADANDGVNGRPGIPFANAPAMEDYYSNDYTMPANGNLIDMAPLRMPNAEDISALSSFVSNKFNQFLSENGIPKAPETIRFDDHGQMVLPDDYPYGEELKGALANNPGMERALRDLNGMSSQFAEIQKLKPYLDEVAGATTQAEADAIVAKYMHLFDQNRPASQIALRFSDNGELAVTADGTPLDLSTESVVA